MLRFKVFHNGRPATDVSLDGAYMVGSDGVPLRAEITYDEGELRCAKRAQGPAGLALLWPVNGHAPLVLETTRLMERDEPYNLHVELARGRLMRISQKREDWGLYDFPDGAEYYRRVDHAKALLVEAMTNGDEAQAARLGDESLAEAIHVGEDLSLFHAGIFLKRRKASGQFVKRPFGCGVAWGRGEEGYRQAVKEAFDFAVLPINWRDLEPKEGTFKWDPIDLWVNWLGQNKLHVRAAPLISLERSFLPDWSSRWEGKFEALQEHLVAQATRVVQRFTHRVQSWEVIRGAHAFNPMHCSLEQLMELTRSAAHIVKQNAPRSAAIITIVLPWGEYYARDPRTIPPALYADMCVQSGFNFDAFGLQFLFDSVQEGMLDRDMMQISSLIDRFANLGKPIHITAAQAPSALPVQRPADPIAASRAPASETWSEQTQARWLLSFYEIAFSKPFVETVAWRELSDAPGRAAPQCGLLRSDLARKTAYNQLLELRRALIPARKSRRGSSSESHHS